MNHRNPPRPPDGSWFRESGEAEQGEDQGEDFVVITSAQQWGNTLPMQAVDPDREFESTSILAPAAQPPGWSPQPPPTPSEPPSRPPWVLALAIALIVVAATAGVILGGVFGSGGDEAEPGPEAQETFESQVDALDDLLEESLSDRSSVKNAVVRLKRCEMIAGSIADLQTAARERDRLAAELSNLSLTKVPGGSALLADLHLAWESSADADRAFAAWGEDVRASGCTEGQAPQTDNFQAGAASSGTASRAKERFVENWNPVAARAGLPERKASQI